MHGLFLGIDCGTQGSKALLLDAGSGRTLGLGSAAQRPPEGRDGRREQDPADWLEAMASAVRMALEEAAVDGREVRALAVSAQQHGLLLLDAEGRALRPAKLWCDTESAAENRELLEALGGPAGSLERLGLVLAPGYTLSKLLWSRRRFPELFARVAHILLPHDYLNHWLTGRVCSEAGDASGSGYFDVRRRTWASDVLELVEPGGRLAAALPELIEPGACIGNLRPEAAAALGLAPHTRVACGGGDNMLAAIGTGNIRPGLLTASLGTSGTLSAYAERPLVSPHGELATFCASSGGWLPLACTMNLTGACGLVQDLLHLDLDEFSRLAAQAPVGAEGLLMLPFFDGERVPALPHASASLHGMTAANLSRANLAGRCSKAPPSACATASTCCAPAACRARKSAWSAARRRTRCGGGRSPTCSACRWSVRGRPRPPPLARRSRRPGAWAAKAAPVKAWKPCAGAAWRSTSRPAPSPRRDNRRPTNRPTGVTWSTCLRDNGRFPSSSGVLEICMYLVCGEALFDVFSLESAARSNELGFTAIAGGSPFNVAVGLRRLGVEAALFGGLSSDYLGTRLRRVLEEEGVDCGFLVPSDAPTTLAMVGLDASGSAQYQFRGDGCADRQVRLEHLPTLDGRIRGLHVGSYTLVVTPVADTLLALVRRESGRRLVSLDPNVRLDPQPDIDLWRRRVEAFASHAHLIKASEEDLALLYPGRDPGEVARGWLNPRCRLVFVTHGGAGASVHCTHGSWSRPADTALPLRDTVGAGDTFQAATLAYLRRLDADSPAGLAALSREAIDAMLAFAIRAAAVTCSRVGPDLPFAHEL